MSTFPVHVLAYYPKVGPGGFSWFLDLPHAQAAYSDLSASVDHADDAIALVTIQAPEELTDTSADLTDWVEVANWDECAPVILESRPQIDKMEDGAKEK